MSRGVTRGCAAFVATAALLAVAGCRSDGRELRAPVFDPPATTTTSTFPLDPVSPGGSVDVGP